MKDPVMKLTFLKHTEKYSKFFETVNGESTYPTFRILQFYYHGILKQYDNDPGMANDFVDLLKNTKDYDNITITEYRDNRRVPSAYMGFGAIKDSMKDVKIVNGNLNFKLNEDALAKLYPLKEDNGTKVTWKDDPTFTISLSYVLAAEAKKKTKQIEIYSINDIENMFLGEDAPKEKFVVELPIFDRKIYISNNFDNSYMSGLAKFSQLGFNMSRSYIENRVDEYMKVNHIADMGEITISNRKPDLKNHTVQKIEINGKVPVNDYVILTYESRPDPTSVLLPADTVLGIDKNEKAQLEYFILNMGEYDYLHMCDKKGNLKRDLEGRPIMTSVVDVLEDLYLEHDNRHDYLSRGAGYTDEFSKFPFGYGEIIDIIYGTSGMKSISNIGNIYLSPEYLGNLNKANRIYEEYVNLAEIFKPGNEPASMEELKNIDICTDAGYNKIFYSCVAEAIIRNDKYNGNPTFPFKDAGPSFKLYQMNNKFTGDSFKNLILTYGKNGAMWEEKNPDREKISDTIAYNSRPLFINFPVRVGTLDDAKKYILDHRQSEPREVDLSFLDSEKVYRKSSIISNVKKKWKFDTFDRKSNDAELIECLKNYDTDSSYQKHLDKLLDILDGLEDYYIVNTSTSNEGEIFKSSCALLEKNKPWNCKVKKLSYYTLKELLQNAAQPDCSEVASFMNKAFLYDEFMVIDDGGNKLLYGTSNGKTSLVAKLYGTADYLRMKDMVYESWLTEPIKNK